MRRAAEGVDRLVGVADHAQLGRLRARRARGADQLADQDVLGVVGVLVLVDEHVPEPAAVVLGDVREGLQQVHRRHDQVVEVERVGLAQPRAGRARTPRRASARRCRSAPRRASLLVDQLVLQVGDLGGERPRAGSASGRGRGRGRPASSAAGSRPRRRSRSWTRRPSVLGLPAQDPHAGGVEGRDPHRRAPRRPTRAATRSLISAAALLVNVIARISPGWTWRAASR